MKRSRAAPSPAAAGQRGARHSGNGGSLFLVIAAGMLFFKERLTAPGVAGVIVGIVAILVLISS